MRAWRTYTPDGRALEVERTEGRWLARCEGREASGSTAAGALAAALATGQATIGRARGDIDGWIALQASRLEAEAAQS